MVAKSGDLLIREDAIHARKESLFPWVTGLTPNLPETSKALGRSIQNKTEMEEAADHLLKLGPKAIALKGGVMLRYPELQYQALRSILYLNGYYY